MHIHVEVAVKLLLQMRYTAAVLEKVIHEHPGVCVRPLISFKVNLVSPVQGEFAAVLNTVDALADCLERPGGCAVVPGLPSDQYNLTLGTSILGGLVAGYASRLQPDGTQPGCRHAVLVMCMPKRSVLCDWAAGCLSVRALPDNTRNIRGRCRAVMMRAMRHACSPMVRSLAANMLS